METFERIRLLRKEHLKMSQEHFGARLGVSRSVIANIETNVLARPEQKEPLYRLICSTFNINYDWLTTGDGEMKDITSDELVDKLSVRYGLDDIDKEIILLYITVPQSHRLSVRKIVKAIIDVGNENMHEAKEEHKQRVEETRTKSKSLSTGKVVETIIPTDEEIAEENARIAYEQTLLEHKSKGKSPRSGSTKEA